SFLICNVLKGVVEAGIKVKKLNFHVLFFFGFDYLFDSPNELIGYLLNSVLTVLEIIRRDFFLLFGLFEPLDGVASMTANRDTKLFSDSLNMLHQFLASFFGELWNRNPNDLAVIIRCQAKVRLENCLLDISHRAPVKGLDDQEMRVRRTQRGQLIQRRMRPIILDDDMLQERGRSSTCP